MPLRRDARAHRLLAQPCAPSSTFALLAASVVLVSSHAGAQKPPCSANPNVPCWPPIESFTSADMADPDHWPDDPGYGYDEDHDGQWNYYSFVPTQSGTLTLRPGETSSGMSIDLAWRYTIGDDRVRIAVMDSGIKWDEGNLLDKVWLNDAELTTHKPTDINGMPCGDAGTLVGYDCNGDAVFTVADYASTPTLQPPPTDGRPLGDMNRNGVLDGGDIIMNFSDGIDDDMNGYIDDIAGWDFLKDDNDPYDDTRYGHGTGEAGDSTAKPNDGVGDAGGCGRCRFIPMRVGDSFIADVHAFGQGVVYAVDNGASIVQSALGTINMTQFAQAALDYAHANNVITIASMADENSRHHNMPTTANHTLPAHAIQYEPTARVTNVETYLDFNPCTNFGGQNYLSVAGTGCSSEAVGQLSGMTGLLYSAALKYGVSPELTADEALQLWITTTDDIDIAESRDGPVEERPYYWSQAGFDQRFGYGRTNANTAVERVKDGRIPPEVDVVRPYWFEVLYRDQLDGPVEIRGTIAAKRATSYDWLVEWAPGVQPADAAFQQIAAETNVPASLVTGGDEPITTFDVRTIDTTHEPDPDSRMGENQYTITVRIRAVAHYGGGIGDVPGELRRTYAVYADPTLVKGFPVYVGDSGEASPKLADLDGDGVRDVIYPTGGGRIHAWKITSEGPRDLPGWPFRSTRMDGMAETPVQICDAQNNCTTKPNYLAAPGYASMAVDPALANDAFLASPAIADVDGDGSLEVVATTWNGFIHVIEHDGTLKEGWPIRLPEVPSCARDGSPQPQGLCMGDMDSDGEIDAIISRGAFGSPVLEDMNKDGELDIIQAAFDGGVYVFELDGSLLEGWPVFPLYNGDQVPKTSGRGRMLTTPAVADFDGDGYPELLVGTNERLGEGEQAGSAYLIDGRGTNAGTEPYKPHWPITMTSFYLFPVVAEGVPNSGVIGRFDGKVHGVVHGNASAPLILPVDPGEQADLAATPPNAIPKGVDPETGAPRTGVAPTGRFGPYTRAKRPDVMFPLFANPSLADIDQDGVLDVIASGSSLSLAQNLLGSSDEPGQQLVAAWSGATGDMLPGAPFLLEDYSFFNSQTIADLNGDDYPEIVVGSAGYYLHAFDGCGREPTGWPKFTGQWIIPTPAVGDVDGDDKLEVVTGTRSGWVYMWHTDGAADGQIQWESFHHDNRNTGNYDTPLERGDTARRAAEPMTAAFCEAALGLTPDDGTLRVVGGCGACVVGPSRKNDGILLLVGGALVGSICARRRRPLRD